MSGEASGRHRPVDDPRQRFSGAAQGYARHRPGYPETLVDWVVAEAAVRPGDPVADVGCGTGIFTRMLARRGWEVIGIDPNEDMLSRAREAGGPEYRQGAAEATGLPDHAFALATVAQAFHWFALDEALAELGRILRPTGHAAAVWNIRGHGDFMAGYDALLRRFSSEYQVLASWEATLERLKGHPRVDGAREHWAIHAQRFDLQALRGRAWSSSYVFRGVEDRDGFDSALRDLFERHASDGTIAFPYRTVALAFRITRAPSAPPG